MHEYGITEEVVAAVAGRLPDATVTRVHLEIGSLSGVSADSVRFYFGPATEGTNLAGASLEISEVAARCRCRACGEEFEPDGPIPLCSCGSPDAEVLSGGDLRILAVDVAAAPA
ncbi:MAG TPA: hydrogenase maturation nickel metallochaperone HypA [Streptosporangiaceae bacterium]